MKRNWMRFGSIPALVLSLALWSCDSLDAPSHAILGPDSGPSFAESTEGSESTEYKVVQENVIVTGTASAVIDSAGGELKIDQHVLKVPAGAVSAPTTFTVTKLSTTDLKLSLTATQVTTNDIGSQGFAKSLTLKLHFGRGVNLPADLTSLRGAWVKLDGSLELQNSSVDVNGKNVFVTLDHFSDYALVMP